MRRPENERIMDRFEGTFSFRNNTENNAIEIAFNVEIRPTFVADVFLMLKLKDVKRATPEILYIKGSIAVRGGRIFFSFIPSVINKQSQSSILNLSVSSAMHDRRSDFPTTKFPPIISSLVIVKRRKNKAC